MKKKTILAALLVAVLAFGFISCKKVERKCWKITYHTDQDYLHFTGKFYFWGSEAEADALIEESLEDAKENAESEGYTGYSCTKVEWPERATQADCYGMDE